MDQTKIRRRDFLRLSAMAAAGAAAVACQPQTVIVRETVVVEGTPVEVEVTKVVKETVEVEKVVKETVEVEKEKVVKETIEVEVEAVGQPLERYDLQRATGVEQVPGVEVGEVESEHPVLEEGQPAVGHELVQRHAAGQGRARCHARALDQVEPVARGRVEQRRQPLGRVLSVGVQANLSDARTAGLFSSPSTRAFMRLGTVQYLPGFSPTMK